MKSAGRKIKELYLIMGVTFCIHLIILVCFFGLRSLYVENIDWMVVEGDLGAELFGSLFFARSDWQFPIGLMDDLAFGTQSIVYFDGLPVLSMVGKLLRNFLPEKFQLWGIYSFLVFGIQGSLGACCVYKFIKSKFVCIAGSFLFSMQMIFLSHVFVLIPLSSHWILLCTFLIALYYEQLKTPQRAGCIAGILAAVLFVQTAFLPMVLCILFFRMVAEITIKRTRKILLENIALMITGILSIVISAWLLGLFNVSANLAGGGLGNAAIRLDSFINSMGVCLLLPGRSSYQLTSAAYLGVGVIILFCIAAIAHMVKMFKREHYINRTDKIYLVCALIAMGISIFFALGPIARWGTTIIYEIPLNDIFFRLWSMVRTSSRLAWSVVYGLVIISLWILSKIKLKWKNAVVILCAFVQLLDMIPMLNRRSANINFEAAFESPLVSNVWEELSKSKDKVIVMNGDCRDNSMTLVTALNRLDIYSLAYYAYENGMKLTDFYYARRDSKTMNEARTDIWNDLYEGKADERAIYLFIENPVRLMFEDKLNFYWVDGYLIGVVEELNDTAEATGYDVGAAVSIMPLSRKSILYAENAEYDGEAGRILHPQGRSWGPQISLVSGRYRISIVGKNLDNADVECVSKTDIKIPMENIQVSDDMIIYEIDLVSTMTKIDFIVANPSDEEIHLKDMTIVQCNE